MKTKIFNVIRNFFKIPFFERTLRTFVIGKEVSSVVAKLVPNNYQYSKESIREFEYKGVRLKLDIHDYVAHYLYFGFKDISHEKLMSLLKKDDVVVDIGTNYGTTILQFAKIIGKNGVAYGFEPDPVNFSISMENLKLNTFRNIQIENVGLGNSEKMASLVVDTESNRGGNRISSNSEGKESHLIRVVRFDDWATNKNFTKINLIKIDVEGYELEVLNGAVQTLKKFKPILFIELDDKNLRQQNSSARAVIKFLLDLNYEITHSENRQKITLETDFTQCHFDVICN